MLGDIENADVKNKRDYFLRSDSSRVLSYSTTPSPTVFIVTIITVSRSVYELNDLRQYFEYAL